MKYTSISLVLFMALTLLVPIGVGWASSGCEDAKENLEAAITNREIAQDARNHVCRPHPRNNPRPIRHAQLCLNGIAQVSQAVKAVQRAALFFEECKDRNRL